MYDREDGCLIIGLCVFGSLLLTVVCIVSLPAHPAPGQHPGATSASPLLLCLGAWVFTLGVIVAEALRDQFRRPRH